jgi:hypothetical protein
MTSKIDELIAKLPAELREIAERYQPAFEEATDEAVETWIAMVTYGKWREAYRFATRKMSTDELVAEQVLLNSVMADLNSTNAKSYAAQRQIVRVILTAFVRMGVAAASGD